MSTPPYVERLTFKLKFKIPGGYPNTFWVQTLNPPHTASLWISTTKDFRVGNKRWLSKRKAIRGRVLSLQRHGHEIGF